MLLALSPFSALRRTYHLTAHTALSMASVAEAASRAFEGLDLRLLPRDATATVSMADRLADRMMAPFKPYYDSNAQFDRKNLQLDAPQLADQGSLDPLAILRIRSQREMGSKIA